MTRARRIIATLGGAAVGGLAFLIGSTEALPTLEEEAQAAGPDAGPPTFVTQAQQGKVVPPDIDDVEQMCALLMSCPNLPIPPNFIPTDFGGCVKKMADEMTSPGAV